MKISNIRIEDFIEGSVEKSRLICDVDCGFSNEKAMWFTVERKYKGWLCDDVYDAFLMALLYPAMYNQEDIEIDGAVSRKLLININNFVQAAKNAYDKDSHIIKVKAKAFATATKLQETHVGLGFGAGIDSFCSLEDHFFHPIDDENKVDTLCFLLVDNYGDPCEEISKKRGYNFYKNTEAVAKELGINACFLDGTSMFKFHVPHSTIQSERDARIYINGFWARIACVLSLQRGLRKFLISSSSSYRDSLYYHNQMYAKGVLWLDEWCEGFLLPMVSPIGLDIVSDGAQYPSKNEKIEKVINLPIVRKHLRACTGFFDESGNDCGHCKKCIRMMLILDILGQLDKWEDHFPISYFKRRRSYFQCDVVRLAHTDDDLSCWSIIRLAEKYNYKMPTYFYTRCFFVAAKFYKWFGIKKVRDFLSRK